MKQLTTLLLVFFSIHSIGQVNYQIDGILHSNDEPIPYATLMLHSTSDSSMVKATFSDSVGSFVFTDISNGSYFIKVSAIGYLQKPSETIVVQGKNVSIGKLEISPSSQVLEGYEVVAMRPIIEVEADKLVFNVDKTLNATGSNGYDLLRKAPGVVIDNNGQIILEGKSGIQIFINGKQSFLSGDDLISYLKSLQSSNIDAVEIITQPSSKYDAAGNAGIINIRLKKSSDEGTNGSVTAGYSYGVNHRSNLSGVLNHRKKKSNFYSSLNNSLGNTWRFVDFNRLQEGFNYISETDNKQSVNSINGLMGYDWFINDKHTFGVLASGNLMSTDLLSGTVTTISPENSNVINQTLISESNKEGHNYQVAGNVNYNYKDSLGHELTVNGDYALFNRVAVSYQPNTYYEGNSNVKQFENNYRMNTPTSIEIAAANVDYSFKLLKGKASVGAKYSSVATDNTFEFFGIENEVDVLDSNRTNYFSYTERVTAGYVNYARKISKKLNFQGGLRVERTQSHGILTSFKTINDNEVKRDYTNYFPSAGLTYNQSSKHIFSVNYSKRIQRPNYQSLNPFEEQINELAYRKGNPFLQPQYGSNMKLTHLFKRRYSTSITYSFIQDYFAQITDTLGTNKSFLVPRNVANQQVITLGASLPIQVTKWWNMFLNMNAYQTSYEGTDDKFQPIDINTFGLYTQNTFKLPKDLKLEVSGWYRTPSIWGGTYLTKSMGAMNVAFERKFLNELLVTRLAFSDIFFTSPWRANLQYGVLISSGTGGWESRKVDFTVTYQLGNQKLKRYRQRETSLDEEKNRTSRP